VVFFNGVFVRFSTRGVQKHHTKLFWGSPCRKLFAKKVEKKNFVPVVCRFSFSFFLTAFLAVSLHDELKNTTKMCSKTRPENLTKKPQKISGR
jgi:hypothetical protein